MVVCTMLQVFTLQEDRCSLSLIDNLSTDGVSKKNAHPSVAWPLVEIDWPNKLTMTEIINKRCYVSLPSATGGDSATS